MQDCLGSETEEITCKSGTGNKETVPYASEGEMRLQCANGWWRHQQ